MVKPWESRKVLIQQWRRRWSLKPRESITCPCGFKIDVPSPSISSRRRYNILSKAVMQHLPDCPIAKDMGI